MISSCSSRPHRSEPFSAWFLPHRRIKNLSQSTCEIHVFKHTLLLCVCVCFPTQQCCSNLYRNVELRSLYGIYSPCSSRCVGVPDDWRTVRGVEVSIGWWQIMWSSCVNFMFQVCGFISPGGIPAAGRTGAMRIVGFISVTLHIN